MATTRSFRPGRFETDTRYVSAARGQGQDGAKVAAEALTTPRELVGADDERGAGADDERGAGADAAAGGRPPRWAG